MSGVPTRDNVSGNINNQTLPVLVSRVLGEILCLRGQQPWRWSLKGPIHRSRKVKWPCEVVKARNKVIDRSPSKNRPCRSTDVRDHPPQPWKLPRMVFFGKDKRISASQQQTSSRFNFFLLLDNRRNFFLLHAWNRILMWTFASFQFEAVRARGADRAFLQRISIICTSAIAISLWWALCSLIFSFKLFLHSACIPQYTIKIYISCNSTYHIQICVVIPFRVCPPPAHKRKSSSQMLLIWLWFYLIVHHLGWGQGAGPWGPSRLSSVSLVDNYTSLSPASVMCSSLEAARICTCCSKNKSLLEFCNSPGLSDWSIRLCLCWEWVCPCQSNNNNKSCSFAEDLRLDKGVDWGQTFALAPVD